MKQFVVFFALIAVTIGAPVEEPSKRSLPAVEHKEEREDSGPYSLRYVTAEGTIVSERAHLIPTADGKDKVLVSDGEVSFVGPDGKTYVSKWSAGLDGMKVEGAHLPVAPEPLPVPVVAEPLSVIAPAAEVVPAPAIPPALAPAPVVVPAVAPARVIADPAIPAAPVLPQSELLVFAY